MLISTKSPLLAKFIDLECSDGDCSINATIDDKDLKLDFEEDTEIVKLRLSKTLIGSHINSDKALKVTIFNGPVAAGDILWTTTIDLRSIKNKNRRIPLDFIVPRFTGEKELYIELTDIDHQLIVLYKVFINGLDKGLEDEFTTIDPDDVGIIDKKDCANLRNLWDRIECNNDELILKRLAFELDNNVESGESFIVKDEKGNYIIKIPSAHLVEASLEAQRIINEEKEAERIAEEEAAKENGSFVAPHIFNLDFTNGRLQYSDETRKIDIPNYSDINSYTRGIYEGRISRLEGIIAELSKKLGVVVEQIKEPEEAEETSSNNETEDNSGGETATEEDIDETYTMAKIAFSINKVINSFNGILFKIRRESNNCFVSTWFEQVASLNPAYQNSPDKQPLFNSTSKPYGIKFDTGAEVDTRQVIFKEGGTTNGLNVYIENGQIYWSIWSQSTGWSYTYISTAIGPNQEHTLRFHYDGTEGFLEAYLDGQRIKRVLAGEKLAKHIGNNGIGAQVEHSYYLTGSDSRMEDFAFKGTIMEFIYY